MTKPRPVALIVCVGAFALLSIGADSCDTNTSSDLGGFNKKQKKERQARVASKPERTAPPPTTQSCDPNYAGACLDPSSADYDCAGGSGNGPDYTGYVRVVGTDHYGLDADGDGVACE
jgi:hypothetical protein